MATDKGGAPRGNRRAVKHGMGVDRAVFWPVGENWDRERRAWELEALSLKKSLRAARFRGGKWKRLSPIDQAELEAVGDIDMQLRLARVYMGQCAGFSPEQFHRFSKLVVELTGKKTTHLRRLGLDSKSLDVEGEW